jgi:uncharacterized protein with beta-barrel porin domain
VRNGGSTNVDLKSEGVGAASADADAGGSASAYGRVSLQAVGVGIEAGAGADLVGNAGSLVVDVTATVFATDADVGVTAAGIVGGDGDDAIDNSGTLTAFARATGGAGYADVALHAVGIDAGDGNDAITNAGTIEVGLHRMFFSPLGTSSTRELAIDAGAGDDVVRLGTASVTRGDIDLGSGRDLLVLEGVPSFTGVIQDETARVTFGGAGPLSGAAVQKTGAGTLRIAHSLQFPSIDVQQGVLRFEGNQVLAPDGLLRSAIRADGTFGQLQVGGTAALDGTLTVARDGGAYVDGMQFDVVVADAGLVAGTTFDTVNLPANAGVLSFGASYMPDRVRVTTQVSALANGLTDPTQRAVAQQFDRMRPAAGSELDRALATLQTLDRTSSAGAIAMLGPRDLGIHGAAAATALRQYTSALQDRLSALRFAALPTRVSKADARRGPYGRDVAAAFDGLFAAPEPVTDMWVKGYGERGDLELGGGRYDYEVAGFTVGFDRRLTDRHTVGLMLGRADDEVEATEGRGAADVRGEFASLYGGWFDGRYYADATVSYGTSEHDGWRTIVVGDGEASVLTEYRGHVYGLAGTAGAYGEWRQWWIEPFGHLQYARLRDGAFEEQGSDLGFVVGARTTDRLASRLGMRISRPFAFAAGTVVPQAGVAWLRDYAIDDGSATIAYVGAPDAAFVVPLPQLQRNAVAVDLGLSFYARGGFATSLRYSGEFRGASEAQSLVGELHWRF